MRTTMRGSVGSAVGGASAISVWKKELGPKINDVFLRKDLERARIGNAHVDGVGGRKNAELGGRREKYSDFVCRENFTFDENITCFPNYMHKASLQIRKKFEVCDIILEVRDARLPFTSTNDFVMENWHKYGHKKKRVIILNKVDLIPKSLSLKAKRIIEEKTNALCLLTSSKYNKSISKIRDICREIKPKFKSLGIFAMLIGLPNVGKSSIINSFKELTYNLGKYGHTGNKISFEVNRKKIRTNVIAGTTKIIDTYKVSNSPLLYFLDTPGIFLPKMADKEIALKLSAIGITLDYKYDHMYVGDYILFTLNKYKHYKYVKMFGLDGPTNDLRFVCNVISTKLNLCRNYKFLDINGGCRFFIDMFRLGLLGNVCLDPVVDARDLLMYSDFPSAEPPSALARANPAPLRGFH
ncbi:GTP-binding protein, putative [Plasmodium ovale]|uniref:GTP-binding protein, putative n=2 Tax=Plasmodium ovale TaxID=36330 RepID=A0A1C3KWX1_PLAOA|nr:GTP-binding protein, putative [Plasmodium ovale]